MSQTSPKLKFYQNSNTTMSKIKPNHHHSANLREERKMFSVLEHSFLLSYEANSGFTLSTTPPEVICKLPTCDQ